jgi:hypothetical protein
VLSVGGRLRLDRGEQVPDAIGDPAGRAVGEHAEEAERGSQVVLAPPAGQRLVAGEVKVRQDHQGIHGNGVRVTVRGLGGPPQPGGLVRRGRVQHLGRIP